MSNFHSDYGDKCPACGAYHMLTSAPPIRGGGRGLDGSGRRGPGRSDRRGAEPEKVMKMARETRSIWAELYSTPWGIALLMLGCITGVAQVGALLWIVWGLCRSMLAASMTAPIDKPSRKV